MSELSEPSDERRKIGIEELRMILDLYKHHWDATLKMFGLYLVACSVLIGYGLSQQADIYNRVFSGAAVVAASIFTFVMLKTAQLWVNDFAVRATAIAGRFDVTTISF